MLEEEAKPLLIDLISHFEGTPKVENAKEQPEEEEGKEQAPAEKELHDNPYSFTYRKKYAQYLRKFGFYE